MCVPRFSVSSLVHRSLAQDDGRGLFSSALDETEGRLRVWLVWGRPSAALYRRLHERLLAIQAPLVPFLADCPAAAGGSRRNATTSSAEVLTAPPLGAQLAVERGAGESEGCTRREWHAAYKSTYEPVGQPLRSPLMLWPRPRTNDSSRLLVRAQRPCAPSECGDDSLRDALVSLLAPSIQLLGLREVGLTGGPLPARRPVDDVQVSAPSAAVGEDEYYDEHPLEVRAFECEVAYGGVAVRPASSGDVDGGSAETVAWFERGAAISSASRLVLPAPVVSPQLPMLPSVVALAALVALLYARQNGVSSSRRHR